MHTPVRRFSPSLTMLPTPPVSSGDVPFYGSPEFQYPDQFPDECGSYERYRRFWLDNYRNCAFDKSPKRFGRSDMLDTDFGTEKEMFWVSDVPSFDLSTNRQNLIIPLSPSPTPIRYSAPVVKSPLELPELLVTILEFLIHDEALYHCLFVSKSWSVCASKLLWRHVRLDSMRNAVQFLALLEDVDKKQGPTEESMMNEEAVEPLAVAEVGSREIPSLENKVEIVGEEDMAGFPPGPFHLCNSSKNRSPFRSRLEHSPPAHAYARGIRTLTIHKIKTLLDSSLLPAARRVRNLRSLELYICENVGNSTVSAFARSSAHHLQDVRLPGCNQVDDLSVTEIAKNCPKLKHIDLRACGLVSDAGIIEIAKRCSGLVHINIGRIEGSARVSDRSLEHLAALTQVSTLGLAGCGITDRGVGVLAKYRAGTLERLSLNNCAKITHGAVSALARHCPGLAVLEVKDCVLIRDMSAVQRLLARKVLVEFCDALRVRLETHLRVNAAVLAAAADLNEVASGGVVGTETGL